MFNDRRGRGEHLTSTAASTIACTSLKALFVAGAATVAVEGLRRAHRSICLDAAQKSDAALTAATEAAAAAAVLVAVLAASCTPDANGATETLMGLGLARVSAETTEFQDKSEVQLQWLLDMVLQVQAEGEDFNLECHRIQPNKLACTPAGVGLYTNLCLFAFLEFCRSVSVDHQSTG